MFASRQLSWFLLIAFATIAFLAFSYPMYVIRPFRAQGSSELALALAVRSWGPHLAIAAAIGAMLVGAKSWKGSSRKLLRFGIASAVILTIAFTILSHVNVYERMFRRIDSLSFTAAGDAKLDDDDMVLSIQVDGVARAYSVRMLAYHHIANDLLGRVPIVSTY